ncbi:SH3 domain-containing protein (plasmid) [Clostridium perfringens]
MRKLAITSALTGMLIFSTPLSAFASEVNNSDEVHVSHSFELSDKAINTVDVEADESVNTNFRESRAIRVAYVDLGNDTESFLNVRDGVGTSSNRVLQLSSSTPVRVSSVSNGWAKITGYIPYPGSGFRNFTGYVSNKYLNYNGEYSRSDIRTTSANLNVRKYASTNSSILHTLSKGSKVNVLEWNTGTKYAMVWSGYNKRTGYVIKEYL